MLNSAIEVTNANLPKRRYDRLFRIHRFFSLLDSQLRQKTKANLLNCNCARLFPKPWITPACLGNPAGAIIVANSAKCLSVHFFCERWLFLPDRSTPTEKYLARILRNTASFLLPPNLVCFPAGTAISVGAITEPTTPKWRCDRFFANVVFFCPPVS